MRVALSIVVIAAGLSWLAPAQAATTYTYDTLGRVSTVTYDSGLIITYSYDPAGNRTQVVTHT
jgi:YD repeat-containing protein